MSRRNPKQFVVQNALSLGDLDGHRYTNGYYKRKNLETFRKESIIAAKELYYPEVVIKDITNAKTEGEIVIILSSARNKYL